MVNRKLNGGKQPFTNLSSPAGADLVCTTQYYYNGDLLWSLWSLVVCRTTLIVSFICEYIKANKR